MDSQLAFFSEQVSSHQQFTAFFYIFATLGVFIGIIAVALIDAGYVHSKNIIDTIVQKFLCSMTAGISFMIVGYAVWNYQYYQAYEVPNGLFQSLGDWWFGGTNLTNFSQNINPEGTPEADTFQVFSVFFLCFSGLTAALIHGACLERVKPAAMLISSAFIGAVMVPLLSYLTYGSASLLTNHGLHDFVGSYCLYMLVGVWSLVTAWRLGPRKQVRNGPINPLLSGGGLLMLMVAIPMFVLGCGFVIPDTGYFGPGMTTSGMGIVFINVFTAFAGGTLAGSVIAYRTHKPLYVLSGPVAGYLSCATLFDIVMPWQSFFISLAGPFIVILGEKLLKRLGIDDPKVTPLALGPSIFSTIMAGLVGRGLPVGGYLGIDQGTFAFQHATISLGSQLIGIVVVVSITAVAALAVNFLLDKSVGLRVDAETEIRGMDATYWNLDPSERDTIQVPDSTPAVTGANRTA